MATFFRFLTAIPQTLAAAFVFSRMWSWFIVRKFESLPRLGVLDSVGVLMVAGFPLLGIALMIITKELKEKNKEMSDNEVSITLNVIMTVVVYPLILVVAWIWSQIIGSW